MACGGGGNEGDSGEGKVPETVRLGVTEVEGMEQLQTEFGPFKDALEDVLGLLVEFFSLSDRTSATTALEYDQVDLLLAGGSEYVLLKSADEDIYPIAGLTRPGYRSLIISHKDSGIENVEDMKGHSLATRDVASTSGYLMPLKMIMDEGIDIENDIEVLPHGKANEGAFLAKEADIMTITELNYEKLVEEYGDVFNVVAKGELLPNDLIIGSPHLDAAFVDDVQKKIIDNSETLIAAMLESEENDKYSESEYIEANDEDYDDLRAAYEALGVEYQ